MGHGLPFPRVTLNTNTQITCPFAYLVLCLPRGRFLAPTIDRMYRGAEILALAASRRLPVRQAEAEFSSRPPKSRNFVPSLLPVMAITRLPSPKTVDP